MNTAVQARAGTALSAVDRLKQGLTNYRQSAASTSKAPFLKLTKTGEWLYGQKGVEADLEARYVIHPESLAHGWVAWDDGQVEWHMLVSIADPLPPIRDGLKAEKGAEKAVGFLIAAIDGDDEGMMFKWETNSVGGVDAFTDLIDELYAKIEQDGAEELPYPVVTLGTESYQHRKYGKIFKPVFTVVVMLSTIWTSTNVVFVLLLTNGGPANATQILPNLAYKFALLAGRLGTGSAVNMIFFPILAVLIVILSRKMLQERMR